ncbi:MAG TPA: hypothetical protein VKV69_07380 [Actinomycetota bacterium]|nr:hypothetical protein [Actinomycetota bacterium]
MIPYGIAPSRGARAIGVAIGCVLFAGLLFVAFAHPVPIVGLLMAAVLGVALIRFPMAALAGLLFLQPFHSAILIALTNRGGLPIGPLQHWEDFVIVALLARGFAERVLKDRKLPIYNVGDNFVLLYILGYGILALASPSQHTVFEALVIYVEGPMLFLAIRWLRPTRKQLWTCLVALLGAATIMGGTAVYERFGPHEGLLRWYGVAANQVAYSASQHPYRSASFLVDTLILAFYLAGTVSFAAALPAARTRWRPLALLTFAACAGGLICTVTRSGYIGAAAGVVTVLLLVGRNPRIRLALVGLTVLIVAVFAQHYVSNGTLTRGEGDTAHKDAVTRDINLVVAKPFGYGLGTTDRFRFQSGGVIKTGQLGNTEDTYLARALEGGIQALVLYLMALGILLVRVRGVWSRARDSGDITRSAIAAGAIGTIVGIAVAGLFLGVLERVVEILLWGLPAIAISWPRRAGDADLERTKPALVGAHRA